MKTPPRKPLLDSLKGSFVLNKKIRDAAGLEEDLLELEAKNGSNPIALIDSYFLLNQTRFIQDGTILHGSLINALGKLCVTKNVCISNKLNVYAGKVANYLNNPTMKAEFLSHFTEAVAFATHEKQKRLTNTESDTTGQILARKSVINIGKSVLDEIDSNKESLPQSSNSSKKRRTVVIKSNKKYNFHAPTETLPPLNTPRFQDEDYLLLKDGFDIKLRSTLQRASPEAENLFELNEESETDNSALNKIPGATDLLINTVFDNENAFDFKKLWAYEIDSSFLRIMQFVITDYYKISSRSEPYDFSDERTFFCEAVIPIFTSFATEMGNLTFKWCEKESAENKSTWLHHENYNLNKIDTKLLDGYGMNTCNEGQINSRDVEDDIRVILI